MVILHGAEGADHVPVLPEIGKQQFVHRSVPEEREEPQADGVAHAGLAGIEGVVKAVHGGEHLGSMLAENQAGLGDLHAVGVPDEQFFPQLLFDGAQLMGQRRLRDEQVACSVRQVLVFRNGKNVLQMFNFHFQIILSNLLIPRIYYRTIWENFKECTGRLFIKTIYIVMRATDRAITAVVIVIKTKHFHLLL